MMASFGDYASKTSKVTNICLCLCLVLLGQVVSAASTVSAQEHLTERSVVSVPFEKPVLIANKAQPKFVINLPFNGLRNGSKIGMFPRNGNRSQNWAFYSDGTIRYAADPRFCINLHGNVGQNGVIVNLWQVNGHVSQVWDLLSDGTIVHRAHPTFALTVLGNVQQDAAIRLFELDGLPNQAWSVVHRV